MGVRLSFGASAHDTAGVLRLDPIRCDGVGMCAHLAPGLIELDQWGFPLLPAEPLRGRAERAARRAVNGCPRRALFLDHVLDRAATSGP